MIADYKVVYGHDIWALEAKVKELLADEATIQRIATIHAGQGYVINPFYAQVMVKTDAD